MTKKHKILISFSVVFLTIEVILGYFIQTVFPPDALQYSAVVLACVFCFSFAEKSTSYLFTQIALICTVCADFFLVCLQDMNQLAGMVFFSGTQIAYFLRIYFEEKNKKTRQIHFILRSCASVIVLMATSIVLGKNTDALALVSMFYYTNLIFNIVFSFLNFKTSNLLAIGLVCFAVCDTIIGMVSLGAYMDVSKNSLIRALLNSKIDIAWLFYVPSQTLLAISLLPNKFKKRV